MLGRVYVHNHISDYNHVNLVKYFSNWHFGQYNDGFMKMFKSLNELHFYILISISSPLIYIENINIVLYYCKVSQLGFTINEIYEYIFMRIFCRWPSLSLCLIYLCIRGRIFKVFSRSVKKKYVLERSLYGDRKLWSF